MIDEMNAAISAGDEAALSSFFTKDAVLTPDDGSAPIVGSKAIDALASAAATNDFRVSRVAPVIVEGDFATTLMKYTSATGSSTTVAVFQLGKKRSSDSGSSRSAGRHLSTTP